MTKVSYIPKIFEVDITVPNAVDMSYNFKFCAGPDWNYQQTDPSKDFTYGAVGLMRAVVNSFQKIFIRQTPRDIKANVLVSSF